MRVRRLMVQSLEHHREVDDVELRAHLLVQFPEPSPKLAAEASAEIGVEVGLDRIVVEQRVVDIEQDNERIALRHTFLAGAVGLAVPCPHGSTPSPAGTARTQRCTVSPGPSRRWAG